VARQSEIVTPGKVGKLAAVNPHKSPIHLLERRGKSDCFWVLQTRRVCGATRV
jgi:hypothetical protein